MKSFVFLFILVAIFFTYIFVINNHTSHVTINKTQPETERPTLELLESQSNMPHTPQFFENDPIWSQPSETIPDNISQTNTFTGNATPSIPESMTFDQFTEILHRVNPHYPKSAITLDLPMHAIIRTKEEKAHFKAEIARTFHMPESTVETYMQKNRLVWDWINLFR